MRDHRMWMATDGNIINTAVTKKFDCFIMWHWMLARKLEHAMLDWFIAQCRKIYAKKKKRLILHIVAKCENHLLENDNFEKHFFMRSKRLTFFQFFHAFYTDSSTKTFMQGVPAHSTKF